MKNKEVENEKENRIGTLNHIFFKNKFDNNKFKHGLALGDFKYGFIKQWNGYSCQFDDISIADIYNGNESEFDIILEPLSDEEIKDFFIMLRGDLESTRNEIVKLTNQISNLHQSLNVIHCYE